MNNIVLTADSGICGIKREGLEIIPAQLVVNSDVSFPDDGRITNKEILEEMRKGVVYKTSSPLLGDYERVFRNYLEKGQDVIHLTMSSGISEGSVNGANLIANDLNSEYANNVYVINSLTGATGGTLMYELAYEEITNSNLPTEEIVRKLNELKTKIRTTFYVPDVSGFLGSGRDKTSSYLKDSVLSGASNLAKIASLKFRVDFNNYGDLFLKKIFRANNKIGMEKLTQSIVNDMTIEEYSPKLAVIGSLYQDKVNMEEIRNYLLSFNYFERVINHEIGSVVAPYGCNDLCGIALIKKK